MPPTFLWNLKISNFWRGAKNTIYKNFWRRNSHTIWGLFRVYLRSIWGLFNAQIWAKEISCQTWLTARRFRSSINLNKTAARFALNTSIWMVFFVFDNGIKLERFGYIFPDISKYRGSVLNRFMNKKLVHKFSLVLDSLKVSSSL